MNLLSQISPEPLDIVRSLVQHGYEAYIVGGAVRDLLLGVVPKDYDITTSATPEEIRAVFGRRSSRIIGRRFRLVHVYAGASRTIYEVSTFRRQPDSNERRGLKCDDGKMIWNDNVYGTLLSDASRRDFTVNALYL
ncbi:MAG: polynucleotide adenylyltransferase PcnB, partial [Victivallales bacterium]|nr:polynucleotide adenylyltransferase PcnB [Victivallales bacterium]